MQLVEKIKTIYPGITDEYLANPFCPIVLQNDSDGRGDYIAKWEHPEYPEPTDEQLAAVGDEK